MALMNSFSGQQWRNRHRELTYGQGGRRGGRRGDEWIKNRWYKYTMEYYSTIKTDAFESVLTK